MASCIARPFVIHLKLRKSHRESPARSPTPRLTSLYGVCKKNIERDIGPRRRHSPREFFAFDLKRRILFRADDRAFRRSNETNGSAARWQHAAGIRRVSVSRPCYAYTRNCLRGSAATMATKFFVEGPNKGRVYKRSVSDNDNDDEDDARRGGARHGASSANESGHFRG